MAYGKELIIDLYKCNTDKFTREKLTEFFEILCNKINMEREDLHFWDYEGDLVAKAEAPPHLDGISAVQFIRTSDVVVHTLDKISECYINVFSCKPFDEIDAMSLTKKFFDSDKYEYSMILRGRLSKCNNLLA